MLEGAPWWFAEELGSSFISFGDEAESELVCLAECAIHMPQQDASSSLVPSMYNNDAVSMTTILLSFSLHLCVRR